MAHNMQKIMEEERVIRSGTVDVLRLIERVAQVAKEVGHARLEKVDAGESLVIVAGRGK